MTWLLLSVSLVLSFGLTWVMIRYALARQLIDVPNERSSHERPTPRGGGMAIVVSYIGGSIVLLILDLGNPGLLIATSVCGGLVALAGFLDDHHHVPPLSRLAAHFSAAALGLVLIGGFAASEANGWLFILPWAVEITAVLFTVWLLNLYNFMDGIDGIASLEAITVCLGSIAAGIVVSSGSTLWLPPALLVVAVAGFLPWNLQPARIFLGDVGSGFIGIVLAFFALDALQNSTELFIAWLIMLAVFVADATVTLLRRAWRGDKLLDAHRSHAYQHAARRFGAHGAVSGCVALINLFWLLPLAQLVVWKFLSAAAGLVLAYGPLTVLAVYFRAGARDV